MFIGDVELPIVSGITDSSEAEFEEIKPLKEHEDDIDSVPVKHEPSVQSVTITGFINQETHSDNLSLDEQREEIKSLRNLDKFDNDIDYKDYNGYLLVENVEISDAGDSRIIDEVEIEARYFPWPKYYPSL